MSERVKLTKAQKQFLESLKDESIHCLDLGHLASAMAERLKDAGLVGRYFRGFGQWSYRLTEAGRAALSSLSDEVSRAVQVGGGNRSSVADIALTPKRSSTNSLPVEKGEDQ